MYACGKHGLVYVITALRQQYHPTKDNENLLVVSSRVPCRTELLPGRDKAVSPEPLGGLEWSSARRPKGANCRHRRDLRRLSARGPDGDAVFPSRPWQAQANDAVSAKGHVSCPGDLLRRVQVPFRNPPVSPNGVPLCSPVKGRNLQARPCVRATAIVMRAMRASRRTSGARIWRIQPSQPPAHTRRTCIRSITAVVQPAARAAIPQRGSVPWNGPGVLRFIVCKRNGPPVGFAVASGGREAISSCANR